MRGQLPSLPFTISEAGTQLRMGSITSESLTRACIDCITLVNPRLHAFITVTREQALETAAALDRELIGGKDRGPLHGIPVVHKDNYDTRDIPTTVGSELFRGRVPDNDATAVRLLKEAGVVLLGKTNMNEFAGGLSGHNTFYGDTRNPWDLSRSPGGSSSGTAAAIAAGLCLGGTGTDTGGSIRIPASWCGIVGMKPTYGRVSVASVFPRAYSLDSAGPLARSVTDAAVLLDAIAGYDPRDPHSLNAPKEGYAKELSKGVHGVRLGIVENYSFREVDPEVAAAVHGAADTLCELGAEVFTVDVPILNGPMEHTVLFDLILYEFHQILGELYRSTRDRDLFGPMVQEHLEKGMKVSRKSYERALAERPKQVAELQAVFNEVDALLTPATPIVAPLLTASPAFYDKCRQFTLPFNFSGMPAISIPYGFSREGLPIGLQIVGNHLKEALILRIAAALEASNKTHRRKPPLYCKPTQSDREG